ncbi:farnesol dehydrogenase-like [Cimex lectularius]|uniref:Dehydrogenase n=1 Tax=Cimex lectularius TaxID=79782 RepID=A0A8I6S555_CIMLE|nr:farnesol dehydrogenase-like [Cimex lectularius]
MERWCGKVAVVTGASGGIGKAIVKSLVQNGLVVVGLARRVEIIEKLAEELKGSKGELKPMKCDIRNEDEIKGVFDWIEKDLGTVHVLVNNAAVLSVQPLDECEGEVLKSMFDTNVVALSLFAKHTLKLMRDSAVPEGHIININSYVGHLIFGVHGMAPYSASKNAVTVLTEAFRRELGAHNKNIKVTSLSPGLVETEMTNGLVVPDEVPQLKPEDVSDTVLYVLSTPPGVNITELTVMKVGDVIF